MMVWRKSNQVSSTTRILFFFFGNSYSTTRIHTHSFHNSQITNQTTLLSSPLLYYFDLPPFLARPFQRDTDPESKAMADAGAASASPPPMMSPVGTVAVVGPQFCAPYVVALTVTKKALSLSDGDFVVSDVNGNVVMKVKGRVLSLHSRRVLCDAGGAPIVSMREKALSMHHRWLVYRGDSSDERDLLFSVRKSHLLQLKTELDVFLAANAAQQRCDFKVKGSWFDRSCTFFLGDTASIVALMSRQYELKNVVLGRDTFGVTVYPNVDYAFVVAIIVILDEIHRDHHD